MDATECDENHPEENTSVAFSAHILTFVFYTFGFHHFLNNTLTPTPQKFEKWRFNKNFSSVIESMKFKPNFTTEEVAIIGGAQNLWLSGNK